MEVFTEGKAEGDSQRKEGRNYTNKETNIHHRLLLCHHIMTNMSTSFPKSHELQ